MAKQLQLTISEPCHENWEAMTPVEKGRFCDSCQKQVVDFSNMSDRQVANFFKKPSTGSVCGRFMSDQLDRDIEIPRKRMPWVKYFFQFALPAFLLSLKTSSAKAQGQVKVTTTSKSQQNKGRTIGTPSIITPDKQLMEDTIIIDEVVIQVLSKQVLPRVPYNCPETKGLLANLMNGNYSCCFIPEKPKEQTIDISKVRNLSISAIPDSKINVIGKHDTARMINGWLIDNKGMPAIGTHVRIKGTRIGTMVKEDGSFAIKTSKGNVLIASGVGYESKEVVVGEENNLSIIINPITMGVFTIKKDHKPAGKRIDLIKADYKDTLLHAFKIFPNPVLSGSAVTIEYKKAAEGYYSVQLLNQSGQSVHLQQLWIEKKAKQVKINLPAVPAGNYFLVLVNTKTGKKFTEKIIINQ